MPIPRNKKELIEEIIEHYHRLINELNSIPPERRLEKSMEGRRTLGRMIQLNTSSPFKNARLRIRKWKKNFD
jgi:hypothetical protein